MQVSRCACASVAIFANVCVCMCVGTYLTSKNACTRPSHYQLSCILYQPLAPLLFAPHSSLLAPASLSRALSVSQEQHTFTANCSLLEGVRHWYCVCVFVCVVSV